MGAWRATISSRPTLAWKFVSISGKIAIDPSAPPPLYSCQRQRYVSGAEQRSRTHPNWPRASMAGEMAMASWKVMRRDSCASSPQSPPWKRFCWMSSRIANSEQHAAFVAVFPSGHVTRRVSAAVDRAVSIRILDTQKRKRTHTVAHLERGEERDDGEERFERHG